MKMLRKLIGSLSLILALSLYLFPVSQSAAQTSPPSAPAKAETVEAKSAAAADAKSDPAADAKAAGADSKSGADAKTEAKVEEKASEAKAEEAKAEEAAAPPAPNKGDTAWMLVATLLVVMMAVPGLALFYGGLVRAKNVLSVLMQVGTVFSLIIVLWVAYGYSLAFTGGSPFIGGLDKLFLAGITPDSAAATFSKGVYIPEIVFVAFQATFAAITCALIVGAFA